MIIICVSLIFLIGGLEYLHWKREKDLLNRIMAKNFAEYKLLEQPIQKEEKKKEEEEEKPKIDLKAFEEDWSEIEEEK
jgi:hypothetical protein